MVLAMRLERYILEKDDLVIAADLLERAAEVLRRILAIAAGIFLPGAGDPGGRIEQALSVGIVAGLTQQISRSFGIYAYAGYDRLIGDAADSPIVQQFGSEDQFSAGLALYFSFDISGLF